MESDTRPSVREDDIRGRSMERRTFLGRFGAVAGLAITAAACGSEGGDRADTDSGDQIDSDGTDPADFDMGDPIDSD